jgi:predicted nucleotidyltransferase
MTESSSITTNLLSGIEEHLIKITGVELYLFGSCTRNKAFPSDIDVLVLYPDDGLSMGHELADAIRDLSATECYDVLALSESEEHELRFIDSEHAIRIWPQPV